MLFHDLMFKLSRLSLSPSVVLKIAVSIRASKFACLITVVGCKQG